MNVTQYVSKDGDRFYFDPEGKDYGLPELSIKFEDGDVIIWKWEEAKMKGTLRAIGCSGIFEIIQVKNI